MSYMLRWLYLAVDDIEVLIAEVLEDFVDVFFFVKQSKCMQQVAPAMHNVNTWLSMYPLLTARQLFQPAGPA